jgi:ABC-type molybdate transport system substrate-binding protein
VLLLIIITAGCANQENSGDKQELFISAAASLDVMEDITLAFEDIRI